MENKKQIINEIGDTLKGKLKLAGYAARRFGQLKSLERQERAMEREKEQHMKDIRSGNALPLSVLNQFTDREYALQMKGDRMARGIKLAANSILGRQVRENNSMSFKDYFKSNLMEMLFLSEEEIKIRRLRKATEAEAQRLRALSGIPERKEKFGGINGKIGARGRELGFLPQNQRGRVVNMWDFEERVPEYSRPDTPTKPGVGLRNHLLFGTKQNPMDKLVQDAILRSRGRRAPASELITPGITPDMTDPNKMDKSVREQQMIALAAGHMMKHYGVQLVPDHYTGLEIDHPEFITNVENRFKYSGKFIPMTPDSDIDREINRDKYQKMLAKDRDAITDKRR